LGFTLLYPLQSCAQSKWHKYPGNPVIVPDDEEVQGRKGYMNELIYEDGVYRMWFFEWNLGSIEEDIRYATSTDGVHWQISDTTRLRFEHEGEPWDFRLGYFDIKKIDSLYYMWYSTMNKKKRWVIGLARSSDGFNWKKHPEPVLNDALVPQVVFDGEKYYMWYAWGISLRPLRMATWLATSMDGVNWEKYGDAPVFSLGEDGAWDSNDVLTFSVNYDGSKFELWYLGFDLIREQIGYAVSTDGIHWDRISRDPVVKTGKLGEWDCSYLANPQVIKQDSVYRMWYLATDKASNGFGYATTSVEEALSWEQEGIAKPQRLITVRIFNRSETVNVDSLEVLIPDLSGKQLVDTYNKLALAYSLNDDTKSLYYADKALLIAQQLQYPEGMAMAYYSRGNCQYVMDNYADALSNQLSALRIYDSLEDLLDKGHLLSQIASIQAYTGSYELACNYHEQALRIFEGIQDTNFILKSLKYLGEAYLDNRDTINAIKVFKRRQTLANETGNVMELVFTYQFLGRSYSGKVLDSALHFFNEAGLLWDELSGGEIGVRFRRETHYLLIAEAYYAAGPDYYKEAEEYFMKSYHSNEMGSNPLVVRLLYQLAELYYNVNSYEAALKELDGSFYLCKNYLQKLDYGMYTDLNEKLREEVYLKTYMEKIYMLYYLIHEALDNKDLAFDYYQKASEWHDSIFDQQNRRQWAMLQGQYETERAESKIAVLETENEMKSMQVRQTRIFLFVLAAVVVLIVLMGILLFRQNKIKSAHQTLILEQKLFRVQMNPHFMFNALAAIQAYIWNKDPKTANDYLASFSKLLRSILEDSRQEFVPVEKEINTIKNYLRLQSYLHQDKFDYRLEVDEEIDQEEMQIPPMLVQPFLENSIKHGISAKETKGYIEVRFSLDGGVIHVEVEDDGVGFKGSSEKNQPRDHKSLSMKITRDRLMILCKKHRQKFRLQADDIVDEKHKTTGARVSFDVPYLQI
jgi:predicted GH43/DUF377 family glycosyl hydrolase/anti-sigma regulatory factor (Ser/Thr protein kinase)